MSQAAERRLMSGHGPIPIRPEGATGEAQLVLSLCPSSLGTLCSLFPFRRRLLASLDVWGLVTNTALLHRPDASPHRRRIVVLGAVVHSLPSAAYSAVSEKRMTRPPPTTSTPTSPSCLVEPSCRCLKPKTSLAASPQRATRVHPLAYPGSPDY
ncbi:uncharacterized protein J3D65DRAFT_427980 [Phyllosticta citribraziliensis]|uniref:Uncharacterized protein n=1 Tax=Phyllosticta citribraziliensis TaxID=989973 RepID=A0ABR1LI55_9PEZI